MTIIADRRTDRQTDRQLVVLACSVSNRRVSLVARVTSATFDARYRHNLYSSIENWLYIVYVRSKQASNVIIKLIALVFICSFKYYCGLLNLINMHTVHSQ